MSYYDNNRSLEVYGSELRTHLATVYPGIFSNRFIYELKISKITVTAGPYADILKGGSSLT